MSLKVSDGSAWEVCGEGRTGSGFSDSVPTSELSSSSSGCEKAAEGDEGIFSGCDATT